MTKIVIQVIEDYILCQNHFKNQISIVDLVIDEHIIREIKWVKKKYDIILDRIDLLVIDYR